MENRDIVETVTGEKIEDLEDFIADEFLEVAEKARDDEAQKHSSPLYVKLGKDEPLIREIEITDPERIQKLEKALGMPVAAPFEFEGTNIGVKKVKLTLYISLFDGLYGLSPQEADSK